MKRSDFRALSRLRVRYAEVDAQGIVFNAHYLAYLDSALADYWRALALPYPQAFEHFGGDLYVRKASLEYQAPAHYDDLLDIGLKCVRLGRSSLQFEAGVFRQEQLLVSGEMVYVFADASTRSASALPEVLRQWLPDYERGEPMLRVRRGDWAELGEDASAIRTAVFIEEQGIPAALEWEESDTTCLHAVAYNRGGRPVATGRLLEHGPGVAKIGRMAVHRALRGSGVGRAVLNALMQAAKERGEGEVVLHAQTSAEPFYARAGFERRGPEFEEAGIPHVEMARRL